MKNPRNLAGGKRSQFKLSPRVYRPHFNHSDSHDEEAQSEERRKGEREVEDGYWKEVKSINKKD